jgi:hypothetical protein
MSTDAVNGACGIDADVGAELLLYAGPMAHPMRLMVECQ